MKIGNKLNQTFFAIYWLLAVLLLPIALLCRLEIDGVCAFRSPTAHYNCVSRLIDGFGNFLTYVHTKKNEKQLTTRFILNYD